MEWTDVLRILFYLWLFGALGVYAYRGYKRWVRGKTDDLAERAKVGSQPEKLAASDAPKGQVPPRRTMRQVLDDQQAAKKPDPATPEGGLVSAVLKEEIAARKARDAVVSGADPSSAAASPSSPAASPTEPGRGDQAAAGTDGGEPTSERRGLFAPATDDAPDEPAAESPPISALLEGMDMPCNLVPLTTADVVPSPQHVVFVTTGQTPATIGASIGDELERLGFVLRSESDTEVVATRDGDQLRVTLHPDAKHAEKGGTPLFPNVPGGSVAVEFTS